MGSRLINKPTKQHFVCLKNSCNCFILYAFHQRKKVWQNLKERKKGESIMVSVISENKPYDETILRAFEYVKEVIVGIRNIRKQNNIAFKDALSLHVKKK